MDCCLSYERQLADITIAMSVAEFRMGMADEFNPAAERGRLVELGQKLQIVQSGFDRHLKEAHA